VWPAAKAEYNREAITTAIFIRTTGVADSDPDVGGSVGVEGKPVWLPACEPSTTISGILLTDLNGNPLGLEDFVRLLYKNDQLYYEFERKIVVPGLMCFRSVIDGLDNWRNLKRGSKLVQDSVEWVVIGITRRYGEWETEIRLHKTSRFSFSDLSASGVSGSIISAPPPFLTDLPGETTAVAGEDLLGGHAGYIGDDGKIYMAVAHHDAFGKRAGIILDNYDAGQAGRLRTHGKPIIGDWSFDHGPVYVRTDPHGDDGYNLSQTPLLAANVDEDMFWQIGYIDTDYTLVLDEGRQFIYQ
jgi:hypothetical protein